MDDRSATVEGLRSRIEDQEMTIRTLYGTLARKEKELSRLRVLERLVAKALKDGAASFPSAE